MKGIPVLCGVVIALLLIACSPQSTAMPSATATVQQVAEQSVGMEVAQEPVGFPMSEPGPYRVGVRAFSAVDASRDGREVAIRYDLEAAYMVEHLSGTVGSMISFVGKDHGMGQEPEPLARMKHFAVALFGYHLQDREDLAYYFSEEFVSQFDDLAWGVYAGED